MSFASETPDIVKFPDVQVTLVGEDGNAFSILGRCKKAVRRAHGEEAAKRWFDEATQAPSYDELLAFCMETLDVD